jgi:hypothetical protein
MPLQSFAVDTQLEQEKIQLENERRLYDKNYQILQQQIASLTSTLTQLKNSNISADNLQEIDEQLAELQEDLDNLQKSETDLIEREGIFAKNLIPTQNTSSIAEDSYPIMPDWFKNNAKWWKEGLITDSDMIKALESLMIQNVIPLDSFVTSSSETLSIDGIAVRDFTIPSYQKDVFGFWADGSVSDTEIVNSIGHLMGKGIINSEKIQFEISQINKRDNVGGSPPNSYFTNDSLESKTIADDLEESNDDFHQYHRGDDNYSVVLDGYAIEILQCPHSDCSKSISSKPSEQTTSNTSGEMVQLTPITAFSIDGKQYPISQFTLWKWAGECDDAWHFHTNTGQAISLDSKTGISDPDLQNCGFGKVGEIFVSTVFMSKDQIDKFRKLTGYDPLTSKAMTGGSDTGSNTVDKEPGLSSPPSIDQGLSDNQESNARKSLPGDSDGDGIADEIDSKPNEYSDELTIDNGEGLYAKIISRGGQTVKIISGAEGVLLIEVGTDGGSDPVIIEILGVELEVEPGTIFEANFG